MSPPIFRLLWNNNFFNQNGIKSHNLIHSVRLALSKRKVPMPQVARHDRRRDADRMGDLLSVPSEAGPGHQPAG
jgi:hypothetical protein